MNKQQQTALQNWKQNPDQTLPESLENVFLEDCLKKYKDGSYNLHWFQNQCFDKFVLILHFLSRTSDDKSVMPFLDMETIEYKKLEDGFYTDYWGYDDIILTYIRDGEGGKTVKIYKCLRKQLKDQFMDSLTEEGKTLKQALEAITKTYLLNIYE